MGLQLAEVLLHTGTFKLEHTHGVALAEKLISEFIIQRQVVDIDILSSTLLHHVDAVLDDGEVLQTQEVHLDETHVLHHMAVILGHQHILARVLIVDDTHGRHIGDVLRANDNTAGVDSNLAVSVLEFLCVGEHAAQVVRSILRGHTCSSSSGSPSALCPCHP